MMASIWQDLLYAWRVLMKSPGYTVIVVLILALGIGVNTAVFSILDAVFLRPLPYPEPDRLMVLLSSHDGTANMVNNLPTYLDWRAAQHSFTDLALAIPDDYNFKAPGQTPEYVKGRMITANCLNVLGVHPILGRNFTEQEDTPGGPQVALIGESLWRRDFGADPGVIGKRVVIDGVLREIIGVMPVTSNLLFEAQIFVPLGDKRTAPENTNREEYWYYPTVGRLKPGVTPRQASQDLNNIARELERRYPASNTGMRIELRSVIDATTGDYRNDLSLLLGAVGCVLLIACANVANLQLARVSGRQQELAIRAALGASRWRLMRQMLTESTMLGLLGGLFGLLLALWALDGILALSPEGVPRLHDARIDPVVLGFAAVVAVGSGLLVGLWPAWRIARHAALGTALHEGSARGASASASQRRVRSLLVIAQVALAVVLLTGAGLLMRSFWRARNEPVGFRPDGLLMASIQPPKARYDTEEKITQFRSRLLERVRALPGVSAAAMSHSPPYAYLYLGLLFHVTGTPPDPRGKEKSMLYNTVSPGYFAAMHIPLLRGRDFTSQDADKHPDVIIIDEYCAQHYFAGKDPLGQQIDWDEGKPPCTVIGVVPHIRDHAPDARLDAEQTVQAYFCTPRDPLPFVTLMMRVSTGDPQALAGPVRRAIATLDPDLPLVEVITMDQMIAQRFLSRRLMVVLLTTFAGLALLLASIGLYGVIALSVTQRTRELGIRMALGAQRAAVLGLVLRQAATLVGLGLLVGLAGALASGKLLASLLYGVGVSDPFTLALVIFLLAAVALLASYLPARRATRIDPLAALREE